MSLDARRVADNLARVRERIAAAGGDPLAVEVCAAIKYVPADDLPALAEAGITVVGGNRAQTTKEPRIRRPRRKPSRSTTPFPSAVPAST